MSVIQAQTSGKELRYVRCDDEGRLTTNLEATIDDVLMKGETAGGVKTPVRVETDGTANALFIEGSSDRVHIGASSTVNNAFWWSGLGGNDAYAYFGNDASASTNAVLFVNRN